MRTYSQYKNDLMIGNNLIFENEAIGIPKSMRSEMLNRVHYSHFGINKSIELAKECIFGQELTIQQDFSVSIMLRIFQLPKIRITKTT